MRYIQSQDSKSKVLSLALNSNHYLPIQIISIENDSTIWIPAVGSYILPGTNPEKLEHIKPILPRQRLVQQKAIALTLVIQVN